jgi:hypothetical protein
MFVLRFFKILLLVIVAFLFITVAVLFQLNNILHNTLFSYEYFEEKFDRDITAENIEKLVEKAVQDLGKDIAAGESEEVIKNNIDIQWVTDTIVELIKDAFLYFTADSERIPPVDIVPLKETFLNMAKTMIMEKYKAESDIEMENFFKNTFEEIKKGRVTKEEVINRIMSNDEFKDAGISKEAFKNVIKELGKKDIQEITGKEIIGLLVDEVIKEKMGIEQMKDELDLHLLLENIYGSENNPVTGARNLFNSLRKNIYTVNIIIMVLLLLIILAAVYYPRGILRWTGICLMLAGVIYLIVFAAEILINPIIVNKTEEIINVTQDLDLIFVQEFVLSFIKGIMNFMLIQALVITALGILMIIISFFTKKIKAVRIDMAAGQMEQGKKTSKSNGIIVLVRTIAVAAIMIATVLSSMKYYEAVNFEITVFNEINENMENRNEPIDIKEALDKTLNSKLFSSLGEL